MADYVDVAVTTTRARIAAGTVYPDVQVQNTGTVAVTLEDDAMPGSPVTLHPSAPPVLLKGRADLYATAIGGTGQVRIWYPRYGKAGYYPIGSGFPTAPGYFDARAEDDTQMGRAAVAQSVGVSIAIGSTL